MDEIRNQLDNEMRLADMMFEHQTKPVSDALDPMMQILARAEAMRPLWEKRRAEERERILAEQEAIRKNIRFEPKQRTRRSQTRSEERIGEDGKKLTGKQLRKAQKKARRSQ